MIFAAECETNTGENLIGRRPGELPADLLERKRSLHEDLLRSINEGVPVEYEGLIKMYFQSLQR